MTPQVFLLIASLVFIAVLSVQTAQFVRSAIRAVRRSTAVPATATGTIIGPAADEAEDQTDQPLVVEFVLPNGRRIEYQDARTDRDIFDIGDAVIVRYNPRLPELSATSERQRGRAGYIVLLAVVSALTLFWVWLFVELLLMLLGVIPSWV